jgi:RNA polymerase sigma-70 factor (ECF subfamily)
MPVDGAGASGRRTARDHHARVHQGSRHGMGGGEDVEGAPVGSNPEQLLVEVWQELRRIARIQLSRERPGHTLQPTALVNEAYLRLAASGPLPWRSSSDLLALASRVMRQVLIDHARRRGAQKRQEGDHLEAFMPAVEAGPLDLVALDRALAQLRELSPRQCEVVERRLLAGFTLEEIADAMGLSVRSVQRDWRVARAWLETQLTPAASDP